MFVHLTKSWSNSLIVKTLFLTLYKNNVFPHPFVSHLVTLILRLCLVVASVMSV